MLSTKISKIKQVVATVLPFICLAGIVVLQGQEYKRSVQKLDRANYLTQEQEEAKSLDWQKRSPNLGFSNLKADWSYLNFVQYFGDKDARDTIGYKLVPDYFETIAHIDPRFTTAHLKLSIANSMYAGDPEKTIALMQQVLDTIEPISEEAVAVWTSKGLDELLFMGDKVSAIESYKMAEQWAALVQNNRSEKLTIKNLESALESTTELELKEAQLRAWSSVLVHIKDHQRRREIIDRLDRIRDEILVLRQSEEEI